MLLYQKPKFILSFTVFITLCGMLLASHIPISLYPIVNKPTVRVTLRATQDMFSFYQEWGIEMERSMKSIEHVKSVEGTYKQGLIRFHIHFDWNVTPETAKRDVATVISFYQAQLPEHEPDAIVDILDPSSENYLAITSKKYSNQELSELLKDILKPQLDAIEGVAASKISQKEVPFINVRIKPYKLLEYGISLDQILDTLAKHQYDYKLGQLNTQDQGRLSIKFKKSFQSLDQLRNIKVNAVLGKPIHLSDIATVQIETEVNHRFFQLDEKPIVSIAVWPKPDANIYQVSTQFQQLVHEFTQDIGDVIILNNPKRFIEDAIMSIIYALCMGMMTAALLVLIFYRKLKSTFIICITMPIALMIGILFMKLLDVGINLLSLGGMSICIGLVVDNVIIILDRLERQQKQSGVLNTETMQAAMKSITPPILTSTLTSIIVFLPLAFTAPAVSAILKDISLVTVTILFASSFLSLFFVPVCYMALTKKRALTEHIDVDEVRQQSMMFRATAAYLRFFNQQRAIRVLLIASVFMGCLYSIYHFAPQLRTEIVAKPKAEIIDINIVFNESGLNDKNKLTIIKPIREVLYTTLSQHLKYVYTDVRENVAFLSLHLKSYQTFDEVYKRLGEVLPPNEHADISFSPWVTSALNLKDYPSLEIQFLGQNESRNRELAQWTYLFTKEQKQLVRKSKNKPGNKRSQSLNVHLNEQVVDHLLNSQSYQDEIVQLQDFIEFSAEPRKLYDVKLNKGNIPLKVEVDNTKDSLTKLLSVPLSIDDNAVFLKDLVYLESQKDWRQYYSKDGVLRYQVDTWFNKNVKSADIEQFKKQLIQYLKTQSGLDDIPILFNDTQTEIRQALSSLQIALIFSMFAVFLIVLLQFNSIRQALMIVSVIIFGISGATLALYYFNSTFSINSLLGVLILVGLTVNNSILLIDQFNHQIHHHDKVEAVAHSLFIRLRSLIVTNLTTVAGMVPLAIGFGPGKDILQPLGISVSFGLVFATLLTLLVTPLMLLLLKKPHADGHIIATNQSVTS
ncbi:efflux RND transporter permease subunit [Alteromonas sp. a30]|uniref:efflux RND transporter permease subunit n=1 Tax=Alteromonas sp. a30 TaxID=2730917 RepID=UPI002281987A|nr:efflux RND transporter permease subunit [Alteromonas sp. a30]MCY7294569.1 efflux RND transporter permease subunit [Alteromonas sp. a30]